MNTLKVLIIEPCPGVYSLKLDGPLDTHTYETLDSHIQDIYKHFPKNIILDMHKVNYISSMGVGSLFKIRKYALNNNIVFSIASLQPQVQKVLNTVEAMPAEIIFRDIAEMDEYLDALQKKAKNDTPPKKPQEPL